MKQCIVFLAVAMMLTFSAFSQSPAKRVANFNLDGNVALSGYDPVAYFTQGNAVKGKKQFASSFQGVTYYFANEGDKAEFAKNPTHYQPQYGGWCAFAMGDHGEKVEVDPETFKVAGGKLYLFYNKFLNNTLKSWNKDEARLRRNADANWSKILNSLR